MKGDFTRLTYHPARNYSRVLMQQGRVQLDADWNEMVEMQLHFLRTLAKDLIGPHGGRGDSFMVTSEDVGGQKVLTIEQGHYYIDGILCENGAPKQEDLQKLAPNLKNGVSYLLYLDVWEHHLTFIEEEDENRMSIREVALRGPDTTTRTQIVWQVKSIELSSDELPQAIREGESKMFADGKLGALSGLSDAKLKARTKPQQSDDNPCTLSPTSQYRGAENQLYRVEVHQGGKPWDGKGDTQNAATFKWSRENGSVIFPITKIEGDVVTLENLGRDARFGLRLDDWVEISDDDSILQNRDGAPSLLQIKEIDAENLRVTLKTTPASELGGDATKHPILRRWDSPGAITIQIPASNDGWISLEDGVEIMFEVDSQSLFRASDYWLIPARTATGNVEWPGKPNNPLPRPPHGVEHHYAPLAVISLDGQGVVTTEADLRRTWSPLAQ
jgi:hypothetical protein